MEDESIGTPSSPVDTGELTESGSGAEFADYLQACCTARRSGLLTYNSGSQSGSVYLQHGQPIHAIAGDIEGEEAVFQMLRWSDGSFHFSDNLMPHKSTVSFTWEQLLFEGACRADGLVPDSATSVGSAAAGSAQVVNSRIQGGQPKLTIISDELPEVSYPVDQEYLHIGRRDENDIPLPLASVSSRHCLIEKRGNDIIVRDLNSSNGTFVNGEQVSEAILQLGDSIQIGPVNIKLESSVKRPRLSASPSTPSDTSPQAVQVTPAAAANPAAPISRPVSQPLEEKDLKVKTSLVDAKSENAKETFSKMKSITYEDLARPGKEKDKKTKKGRLALIILFLGFVSAAGFIVAYFLYIV